jgi:hypothetical protein
MNGENCIPFDTRPMLGLTDKYKKNNFSNDTNNYPEDVAIINQDNVNVIE